MSLLRLPTPTLDLEAELTVTQFVIPAGAGGTFSASGNIGTVTFNAAHGLTMNPAAGVMPNYFITFGGSSSAMTGTGVLVGNIFRILTIPSTTAITIYTTITAATVTSLTGIPVFFPPFIAAFGSSFAGGPTQTISAVVTPFPPAQLEGATVKCRNGANCAMRVNVDQTAVILDQFSTPAAGTPAVAPTWRDQIAASANGEGWFSAPWGGIWANGTTATSTFSVVN
jgi:hypothetical protein